MYFSYRTRKGPKQLALRYRKVRQHQTETRRDAGKEPTAHQGDHRSREERLNEFTSLKGSVFKPRFVIFLLLYDI